MNITINNIDLSYLDTGNGDAVVLLHGWGANKELFNSPISVITQKYRAIAPDLPGFGGSSEPPQAWDVDSFADLTAEFIKALGLESVILLGHSFGGRIALKLASRTSLPFEISKLILVDSAGIIPKRGLDYKLRVGTYKAAKKILCLPPVKALFPHALESMQKRHGSSDYAAASPVMKGCLVKAVNEDLEPLLKDIQCETLLIWGTEDDATPLSDGETMERLIPNAGLAKINGAGHFSWLDSPAVFNAVLASYLGIS